MAAARHHFTPEDECYFALREAGLTGAQCREKMGLSAARAIQLSTWWLGISDRIHKARPSMPPKVRKAEAEIERAERISFNWDDDYVARCRNAGGFVWLSERRDARGNVAVCLPVVRPSFGAAA